MRIIYSFLFIISLGLGSLAVAQPDTLWTGHESTFTSTAFFGACQLADGGFAVAGVCIHSGSQDVVVAKYSAAGTLVWSRAYGDMTLNEQANAVVELADHSFMLVGQAAQPSQSARTLLAMGISSLGDSLWTRSYVVTTGLRKGVDAIALADETVMAVGYKLGRDNAHSDTWLLKLSAEGDTLWTRIYGGNEIDSGSRILLNSDGSYSIAGQTRSYGLGDYDFYLMRASASGDSLDFQTFGSANSERCFGFVRGADRLFLGGRIQPASGGADAYLVARPETGSTPLWKMTYDFGQAEEQISGVVARPGGGAVCAGWSGAATASARPLLFCVNHDGTLEQSWRDMTGDQGQFNGILPATSGGCFAWGTITENMAIKGYVVRYSPAGEVRGHVRDAESGDPVIGARVGLRDSSRFAVTDSLGFYSLDIVPGTYELTASGACFSRRVHPGVTVTLDSVLTEDFDMDSPQYFCPQSSVNIVAQNHGTATAPLRVYNTGAGELEIWASTSGQYPAGNWLSVEPLSAVVAAGDSAILTVRVSPDTTDDGVFDFFGLLTVRSFDCPDSVDVIPVSATVLDAPPAPGAPAREFALNAAYPNPFNPVTTLSYSLPHTARISLRVFDITGRRVATLFDGAQPSGEYRIAFDGRTLASGIYWVQMDAGEFTARQKLVLLK